MSTINSASRSAADVQTAIGLALPGDIVVVPAGSETWNDAGVTCAKGITLDFTGVTITRGTGTTTFFTITNHPTDRFRLTGGTFLQSTGRFFSIGGSFTNAKFRIDHCNFENSGNTVLGLITRAWGLIDNCTFRGEDNCEILHNEAWGSGVTTGWTETVTPGSVDALYVEDCTFSKYTLDSTYFWGCSAIQNYYGSRTVFRYNTCNYCQVDNHGTQGSVGGRWYEIYENLFSAPVTGNQSQCLHLRAGSGVVFNNTMTNNGGPSGLSFSLTEEDVPLLSASRSGGVVSVTTNTTHYIPNGATINMRGILFTGDDPNGLFTVSVTGANTFTYSSAGADEVFSIRPWAEFNEFAQLYPSLYQIGRGKDQELDPLYIWNNTKTPGVTGYASYLVQIDRDFYSGIQKPGYAPLEYPHPLRKLPERPTSPSASAVGPSSITIDWTDASSDEDGFTVERSPNGTTGWIEVADLAPGSVSYTDTGLSEGTQYHYRTYAYNEYGYSDYSETVNAMTLPNPVLLAGETASSSFVSFF